MVLRIDQRLIPRQTTVPVITPTGQPAVTHRQSEPTSVPLNDLHRDLYALTATTNITPIHRDPDPAMDT